MRIINKLVFALLCIVAFSCGSDKVPSSDITTQNTVVVDYAVKGMVCAFGCAKTIEKEVASMDGVSSCSVNYEEGSAHIVFDNTQLKEEDIISKIEGVADGKYKVDKLVMEEESNSANEGETLGNVSLPKFEIPNLFTFLIDQL